MKNCYTRILSLLFLLLSTVGLQAQLTGVRTIPGTYPTLAAALADLNTQGVGAGGVVFDIAAGYNETAPVGGFVVTATGTAGNAIVFKKAGAGANPILTAWTGTATLAGSAYTTPEGVWRFSGSDYVTIDGIDIVDNATANPAAMDFGIGFFKISATDGCQNNLIQNCTITLTRNVSTAGPSGWHNGTTGIIFTNTTATTLGTLLTVTSPAGASSNNKIYNNRIQNVNAGIVLIGFAAATPFTLGETNNDIGGSSLATGNTIINFGGASGATSPASGIFATSQWGLNVSYNKIDNNDGGGVNHVNIIRGIFLNSSSTSASATVNNNTISIKSGTTSTSSIFGIDMQFGSTAASNTININNNTIENCSISASTTSAGFFGINVNSTAQTVNVNNNIIRNINLGTATGTMYGVNWNGATPNIILNGNTIHGFTRSGAGTTYGLFSGSSAINETVNDNTIYNITNTNASTTSYATRGVYILTAAGIKEVKNNKVYNISAASTSTSTASVIDGIRVNYGTTIDISGNSVYGLSGNAVWVSGLAFGGTTNPSTNNVYRNKVYDLSSTNAAAVVSGMRVEGRILNIYNNLVGDLRAPNTSGANMVQGLNITSSAVTSEINAHFNTIHLNASSSGTNFGSSGIFHTTSTTATTATLNLRNNIVVNNSTAAGTGLTVAYRRSSATLTNFGLSSNNLWYAGAPSSTNLIFHDGTNSDQNLGDYVNRVAPRESGSFTENPAFISLVGADLTFLHINPLSPTQIESGGVSIAGITTDYDGDTRNASTPDVGADEGNFAGQDLSAPGINYGLLNFTCATTDRLFTATINDATGVPTTGALVPRVYFRKGAGAWNSTPGVLTSGTATSGTWTFTVSASALGGLTVGDAIQYYVIAQDQLGNITSNPGAGLVATNVNTVATHPTVPNTYSISTTLSGTYQVGAGKQFPTLTAAMNAYSLSCLSGPVTFELTDASYGSSETFPIVVAPNAEASATNTLRIRPAAGVTVQISGSVSSGALIKFNGTDYITIDGSNSNGTDRSLTIQNTATTGQAVIWIASLGGAGNGATNISIRNTVIVGGVNTGTGVYGIVSSSTLGLTTGGEDNDQIVIQNNDFKSVTNALHLIGLNTTVASDGIQVIGNRIGSTQASSYVTIRGVEVTNANAPIIHSNYIYNIEPATTVATSVSAIEIGAGVTNAVITNNTLTGIHQFNTSGYRAAGIVFNSTTNTTGALIANNMISDVRTINYLTSSTFNAFGIYTLGVPNLKIYHNTIHLYGPVTGGTGAGMSSCIYISGLTATGMDIRNNILSNRMEFAVSGSFASLIHCASTGFAFGTINYNNYSGSSSSNTTYRIGVNGTTTVSDLAAWQTFTTQDANSSVLSPVFVSDQDLHLQPGFNVILNGTGTPIPGITIDIDNEVRSTTAPDMGADEFSPPAGIDVGATLLIAPLTTQLCYANGEVVKVVIRNFGVSPLNLAATPVTVNAAVTGPNPQSFAPVVLNSGVINSGDTMHVIVSTNYNMSTAGSYTFTASAIQALDINVGNNAMTPVSITKLALTAGTITSNFNNFCVSGTPILTTSGQQGGNIQWQVSTAGATGPWTNVGTGQTTYSPAVPVSVNSWFRASYECGGSSLNSNVVAITLTTPQVLTTLPGSRCGVGTVTLQATAATGVELRWYANATGGATLATGNSFTTPVISSNTTFFVAAVEGNSTESAGKLAPASTTNTTGNSWGLVFNVPSGSITLNSVDIYAVGTTAGVMSVELTDNAGVVLATAGPFNYPAASTANPAIVTLPLGFNIPTGSGYRLLSSAMSGGAVIREATGNVFPYTSTSGAVVVTNGYIAGTSNTYYWFYNWQVSKGCESARTPVLASVVAPPAISVTNTGATICNGQSTTLTVSSSNAGYNYVWNPGGSTGSSQTVSPTATTKYFVTATDNSGGANNGCVSTDSVLINVTPSPAVPVITPGNTTICQNNIVPLSVAVSTGTGTIGTGTSTNTTSTPYKGVWGANKTQVLYTADELTNLGMTSGTSITQLGMSVTSFTAPYTYTDFTIGMKHTNVTALVATLETGFTTVLAPGALTLTGTAPFDVNHILTSPFVWDGVSNLIVEFCFNNNDAGNTGKSASVASTTITGRTNFLSLDNNPGACGATSGGSTTTLRPNIRITFADANPIVWAPSAGLFTDAAATIPYTGTNLSNVFAKPSATTTYTATRTNAANCSRTASVTITVNPIPNASFSYSGSPFCSSTATATPTFTGTTGGTFSAGTGLVLNATTGVVNVASSTAGTYTVTYSVLPAGGCPAFTTTASITIIAAPSASVVYAGSPYCIGSGNATPTLTGTTGGVFSAPAGLSINPSTGVVNLTASSVGNYTVTYTVAASGPCAAFTTTANIVVNAVPTASIVYAGSPYCSNGGNVSVTQTGATGGTYSSTAGLSINATTGAVNIAASTPGSYVVTYSIAAAGGCAALQTTANLVITPLPAATITYTGSPFCSNGGNLSVIQTGTTGGVYSSTTGLSLNASTGAINLATSTPGSYIVTYTLAAANGCAAVSTTASLVITAAPNATISYAGSPFCGNAGTAAVTQTGNTGGVYTSTTGLSINATTGLINLNSSTPGNYVVTYTIPAANGCSSFVATAPITITPAPSATFSYSGSPYCSNGGTVLPTVTGTTGGSYAAPAGLVINTTTGAVNTATSTPGTYVVTYTLAAANGCAVVTGSNSITITPAPSATISYVGNPFCGASGTANVTRTGTAGGSFSAGTGLSMNASTGAINLSASTPGIYTVTYTVAAAGGCAVFTTTTSVTVQATGTWLGTVSVDWNNPNNWCGGIPTPTTDVVISGTAPNMPVLTSGTGAARNILLNTGAVLRVGTGGNLELYGNITGAGSFQPNTGNIVFRGTSAQTTPGFIANNVTMNGAGGWSPAGPSDITGTLTLTNGHVLLGSQNLNLFNTSNGSVASHVITNGNGSVVLRDLAPNTARTAPVGANASTYSPAILSTNADHVMDDFTVRVVTGMLTGGNTGVTVSDKAVDRTWFINESSPGRSNVNLTLQWTANQELPGFDRSQTYVVRNVNGVWESTIDGPVTGTDPFRQVRNNMTAFGIVGVRMQGIPTPTGSVYPNPTRADLNVVVRVPIASPATVTVYDSKGRLVLQQSASLVEGVNRLVVPTGKLSSGIYSVKVSTPRNFEMLVTQFIRE